MRIAIMVQDMFTLVVDIGYQHHGDFSMAWPGGLYINLYSEAIAEHAVEAQREMCASPPASVQVPSFNFTGDGLRVQCQPQMYVTRVCMTAGAGLFGIYYALFAARLLRGRAQIFPEGSMEKFETLQDGGDLAMLLTTHYLRDDMSIDVVDADAEECD